MVLKSQRDGLGSASQAPEECTSGTRGTTDVPTVGQWSGAQGPDSEGIMSHKHNFFKHWSILRFWSVWLFITCCFRQVEKKHQKNTFNLIALLPVAFNYNRSLKATFKMLKMFFLCSCTKPEMSTSVAYNYTTLFRFIPSYILKGFAEGIVQHFIPKTVIFFGYWLGLLLLKLKP